MLYVITKALNVALVFYLIFFAAPSIGMYIIKCEYNGDTENLLLRVIRFILISLLVLFTISVLISLPVFFAIIVLGAM